MNVGKCWSTVEMEQEQHYIWNNRMIYTVDRLKGGENCRKINMSAYSNVVEY